MWFENVPFAEYQFRCVINIQKNILDKYSKGRTASKETKLHEIIEEFKEMDFWREIKQEQV